MKSALIAMLAASPAAALAQPATPPLVAEAHLASAAPGERARIEATLRASGALRCEALDASTPYESWIVSRYCAHFGVTRHALALPNLYGSLTVTGAVVGESPNQLVALAQAIDGALRESIWYAPGAPALAATVSGDLEATLDAHPVERTATWTESVPSTVVEWVYDAFADPHLVPEDVTHYRDVERTFAYDAVEHRGQYTAQLHVGIDALGIGASTTTALQQHGDDTDAFSAEADVEPARANLPTLDRFARQEQTTLAANFTAALDRGYREQACNGDEYTLETAATCAYAGLGAAPPAVHAKLRETFGAEEPLLAPLLGH